MVWCFTLEWLALGVWVGGGLVLIGAVIPAVFNTFGGQDSGGLFLTRVFEGYHRFMIGALVTLWVAGWYRWWCGDPVVSLGRGEMAVLAGMVVSRVNFPSREFQELVINPFTVRSSPAADVIFPPGIGLMVIFLNAGFSGSKPMPATD